VAQTEHLPGLPSKYEAPNSNPDTTKKKKKTSLGKTRWSSLQNGVGEADLT
jgi:hypothetical protein